MIGPGDYKIQLPPASDKFKLVESEAGHPMLPCGIFPNDARERAPTVDLSCKAFAGLFEDFRTKGAAPKPQSSKE